MLMYEPKIKVLKALKCQLGSKTYELVQRRNGYYLQKMEIGNFTHNISQKEFFLPNVKSLKIILDSDRICENISSFPKLKKLSVIHSTIYNSGLSKIGSSRSIESFEDTSMNMKFICKSNPEFIRNWSNSPISSSLRYIYLSDNKISKHNFEKFHLFKNIVYLSFQELFNFNDPVLSPSVLPNLDRNFTKKRNIKFVYTEKIELESSLTKKIHQGTFYLFFYFYFYFFFIFLFIFDFYFDNFNY